MGRRRAEEVEEEEEEEGANEKWPMTVWMKRKSRLVISHRSQGCRCRIGTFPADWLSGLSRGIQTEGGNTSLQRNRVETKTSSTSYGKAFPFFCYYIVQSAYNESSMSSLIWERRKICSPNRRRHSLSVASLHHLCHPPAGKKIILSPPVTAGWTGWGSAPLWPPVQAVVCVPNDATVLIRCVSYKQSVSSTPPVSERWKKPTAYLIQTQTGAAASDQMSIKEKVKINFFFSLVCCYWLAFNRSIDAARIKVGASRKFPKQMYTLDISREARFEKVMFVLNYIYRSWRSPVRRVPVDPQQSRLYGHLAPLSQVHCCWKTGGKSLPKRKEATVSRRWQEEKLKLK